MNLIRQRDDLKEAWRLEIISSSQLHEALQSPVFWWHGGKQHALTEKEIQFLEENIFTKDAEGVYYPTHTPYRSFRIAYSDIPVYEQWWINSTDALCLRKDDRYSDGRVQMFSLHHWPRATRKVKVFFWVNGKRMDDDHRAGHFKLKASDEQLGEFANSPMEWLGFFLLSVMLPSNVVLKVTPKTEGKSVEWRMAREHYLVLNRQQATKCRERGKGPTDHEIVRAAHWRRAHLRRLVSEKFSHKRGQLVAVKQAWVGPAEWLGLDGKTYKVVNMENERKNE